MFRVLPALLRPAIGKADTDMYLSSRHIWTMVCYLLPPSSLDLFILALYNLMNLEWLLPGIGQLYILGSTPKHQRRIWLKPNQT